LTSRVVGRAAIGARLPDGGSGQGHRLRRPDRVRAGDGHHRRHTADFSIADGIAFGFVAYAGIKLLAGR